MKQRQLGSQGLHVSAIGLGCMGMSEYYEPARFDDAQSIRVIHRYLDAGGNFLDTANVYGNGSNEDLVGKAVAGRRHDVVLATKFGIVRDPNGGFVGIRGDRQYVLDCCDASLQKLRVEMIDLYYQHRVDPNVPIEETIGAMADLVQAGKVRYIGLSEAGPATIRRAHAAHPLSALQTEYSLWTRDAEAAILPMLHELGIGFVAYSPLGRGFLTGQFSELADIPEDDYRRNAPRFQGDNFRKNLELVHAIETIANEKRCTAGQLALAWVLAQREDIVPIPGTKQIGYIDENLAALDVHLTTEELQRIGAALPPGAASGDRYYAQAMHTLDH